MNTVEPMPIPEAHEIAAELYAALRAMPLPPHVPEREGEMMRNALKEYERWHAHYLDRILAATGRPSPASSSAAAEAAKQEVKLVISTGVALSIEEYNNLIEEFNANAEAVEWVRFTSPHKNHCPLNPYYLQGGSAKETACNCGLDALRHTIELHIEGKHFHFPSSAGAADYRHVANEWADELCSAHQWLQNIKAGISTVDDAMVDVQRGIDRCRALGVSIRSAAPAIGQGGAREAIRKTIKDWCPTKDPVDQGYFAEAMEKALLPLLSAVPPGVAQGLVPEGWEIKEIDSGRVTVVHPTHGGCIAGIDEDSIPRTTLYLLAKDLLAAAPIPQGETK